MLQRISCLEWFVTLAMRCVALLCVSREIPTSLLGLHLQPACCFVLALGLWPSQGASTRHLEVYLIHCESVPVDYEGSMRWESTWRLKYLREMMDLIGAS